MARKKARGKAREQRRVRGKGQKAKNKKQRQAERKQTKREFGLIVLVFILAVVSIGLVIWGIIWQAARVDSGCEKFKEDVLWTSGYSALEDGSTSYNAWHLKHNCTELGEIEGGCFIKNIIVKTRFVSLGGEESSQTEGYVKISSPDEAVCDNPQEGKYSTYLASETIEGEKTIIGQYCGKNKKEDKCGGADENYGYSDCYGIKVYGSQYMLVDVLEIDYALCKKDVA